jgi:hypothetical protein
VKLENLRARVSVGVMNAPPPYPLTNPPAEEIKVSHVRLVVDLTLAALGMFVDEQGNVRRTKTTKRRSP